MNARPPIRTWGAKANVVLIFAAVAAFLVVAALVTAAAVDPPALLAQPRGGHERLP